MAEICLKCFNRTHRKGKREYTAYDCVVGYDLCEWCGKIGPCIIRYRRPIGKLFYALGFRRKMLSDEELAEWQAELDRENFEIMEKLATRRNAKKYEELNRQLQNDPNAAVPPEIEQKALEYINAHTNN